MTLLKYFPVTDSVIDANIDPNLPIIRSASKKHNSFGGSVIINDMLPDNSGGSVISSLHIGSFNSSTYNARANILQHMALLYDSHGSVVTPNYGHAIDNLNQQFNFIGVADNSTSISEDKWDEIFMQTSSPMPRFLSSSVFDYVSQRVTLFGGNSGSFLNDTWEYLGSRWIQKTSVSTPTARDSHTMTFDTVRNRLIMFGGRGLSGVFSDTWEWDTTNWNLITTINSPGPLVLSSMCYDSARSKTVLFGGQDGYLVQKNLTWEYNGTNWTQIITATTPQARYGHCMAFDSTRNKTVLFGGLDYIAQYGDTWEYDGSNWTQNIIVGPSPPSRFAASMVYDSLRKTIVLFGGIDSITLNMLNDMWEYDGTSWKQINIICPSVRAAATMSYDPIMDKIILFGGSSQHPARAGVFPSFNLAYSLGDTWAFSSAIAPSFVQTTGESYVYYDASVGRPTPSIGNFLGPGAINGTVTTVVTSPIFGIAISGPIIDPKTSLPLQIIIGSSTVGLIKMRIGAFYGFVTPVAPSISNFSPTFGVVGSQVIINGYGFIGTTQVQFNGAGTSATFQVMSDIQLIISVPAGAQTGTLSVTNATGTITSIGVFTVSPLITSVSASNHSVGSSITINGYTFTPAAGGNPLPHSGVLPSILSFNGTNQPTFTIVNDNTITTIIPNGATSGPIILTTPGGTTQTPTFGIYPIPTISNISPTQGAVGNHVAITGTGFTVPGNPPQSDGYGVVQFVKVGGGQVLTTSRTVFSDTQISTVVPDPLISQPTTNYNIRIITLSGQVDSLQTFTLVPVPTFLATNSFDPTTSGAGGLIAINGHYGFTGLSAVYFDGYLSPYIEFFTDQRILAEVPQVPNITNPNVAITVRSSGGITSTTDANAAGPGIPTNPSIFTILLQPSINYPSGILPLSGQTGSIVHIFGSNLLTIDHVYFSGMPNPGTGASFTSISSTQVDAIVPLGISGITSGHITVTTGIFSATSTEIFSYIPAPSITSINKNSGGFGSPQTQVTITGTNLLNSNSSAPTVKFGGVVAQIISSTTTTVVTSVPNGAANGISLTTDGGTANIAFTVIQPPNIYYNNPTSGRTNYGGVNVNIVGNNFSLGNTYVYFTYTTSHLMTLNVGATSTQISVNTGQIDPFVDPVNGTTFIISVVVKYDNGNGQYQVNSPNTYFGFEYIG